MAHVSGPRLLVLHALRLKGFCEPERLVDLTGLERVAVAAQLELLEAESQVSHRGGRVAGWTLTAAGRALHARLVADELGAAHGREPVERCYREFLGVNGQLLEACTDWQVRRLPEGEVTNDHADVAYDHDVVRRLYEADDKVGPLCARLAGTLERFGRYGPRLATARQRVERGEGEWFTSPAVDSYHAVWFELHEDLLVTLGKERSGEDLEASVS
jgi:hypothetical protein